MNRILIIAISFASGAAVASAAAVSDVKLGQADDGREMRIDYALSGQAIVTWALETNAVAGASDGWVRVPEGQTNTRVWGDVNRVVKKAACAFRWAMPDAWPNRLVEEGRARTVVTAWPLAHPPTYMVVDMIGGPNVRYYASEAALPDGGLANDVYRRSKMVFRKIPAKDVIWTMGVPESAGDGAYEKFATEAREANTPHRVKLTYDYYIGIYEVTRAQWGCVVGEKGSYGSWKGGYGWSYQNFSITNTLPATSFYLSSLRKDGDMGTDTFCGRLRTYHGSDYAFDVASSAEWEFAYRAGEPKTLYTGENWENDAMLVCGNLSNDLQCVGTSAPPNRWGLYDMFGNALDGVRDQGKNWLYWQNRDDYKENGICVDPVMTSDDGTGNYVGRGCYNRWSQAWMISMGLLWTTYDAQLGASYGYRLVCPIPNEQ